MTWRFNYYLTHGRTVTCTHCARVLPDKATEKAAHMCFRVAGWQGRDEKEDTDD